MKLCKHGSEFKVALDTDDTDAPDGSFHRTIWEVTLGEEQALEKNKQTKENSWHVIG